MNELSTVVSCQKLLNHAALNLSFLFSSKKFLLCYGRLTRYRKIPLTERYISIFDNANRDKTNEFICKLVEQFQISKDSCIAYLDDSDDNLLRGLSIRIIYIKKQLEDSASEFKLSLNMPDFMFDYLINLPDLL